MTTDLFACEVISESDLDEPDVPCPERVAWEVSVELDAFTKIHRYCDVHLDQRLPFLRGDDDVISIHLRRLDTETLIEETFTAQDAEVANE